MGTVDLYLALDALGGVAPVNLDRAHPERTVAVVNTTPSPTGEMIRNNMLLFPARALYGVLSINIPRPPKTCMSMPAP